MTPGVFYASLNVTVAIGEMAFRRLLFYAESPDTPWPSNASEYTAFAARFRTAKGLDLGREPLNDHAAALADPVNYGTCQALAEAARECGVEVLRYPSARVDGRNVALLTCRAFSSREPLERKAWRIHVGRVGVRAICDYPSQRLEFPRTAFVRDPRIKGMAWER